MQGTLVIIGTGYAWNVSHIGDQTCLEHLKNFKYELYKPRTL